MKYSQKLWGFFYPKLNCITFEKFNTKKMSFNSTTTFNYTATKTLVATTVTTTTTTPLG
jgi:hypothetical protein